MYQTGTL